MTDDLDHWRTMALAVLQKAGRAGPQHAPEDVDRLLATTTDNGTTIAPLHLAGPPAPALGTPPTPGGWDVRPHHDATDPDLGEALAADIAAGVTSVWLESPEPAVLRAILPTLRAAGTAIVLEAGERNAEAAEALLTQPEPVRGNLGADPIGLAVRQGGTPDLAMLAALAGRCANRPGLRSIVVDGTAFHDVGGGEADELGSALATGVAYLRALTEGGLPVQAAFEQIEFRYAVGADQFVEIAKLRAARLLWARVGAVCGVAPARQWQHAVTSRAMMTARAPWNNLVRTTVAAFAAVAGGADALTVRPFDACLGRSGAQAQRLTRTTQAILRLEAQAARVHDPAAGSWYAERLTRDLAAAGWDWFQKLESNGGPVASLADGMLTERLAATAEQRRQQVRQLSRTIVGVNRYVALDEERPRSAAAPAGHRHAADFERVRDRAEAAGSPKIPLVLLDSATASSDAGLAGQVLAAGGLTGVPGWPAGPAPVALLCGTGSVGDEAIRSAVDRLRAIGVRRIRTFADGPFRQGQDVVAGLDGLLDDLGAAQ
ncbi:methylmalonyl-CoA mutase family protein [Micromonospora sp. NBC_01638]|uniref:methylmalonyl-CoA mutase family protein n=1 Tax=Micromonospora sp. NBC_01638 TaxID=2975982 RepID=UPI0038698732|nr:methylmalonyl-CoA mutase family protein [Micromonospora sp. NBC_01638]